MRDKVIEHSQSQDLQYHKQHPTDFIHGLLCSHVYTNSTEGDIVHFNADTESDEYNKFLNGWHIHKIYSKPALHNYYSVLYINDDTYQAVLAHRCTDIITAREGQHNLTTAYCTKVLTIQQIEAYNSTKDAANIASEKKCNLSFTGHLLGAWLSEISLFFYYMDFCCDLSAGHVKAVTFDSPGILNPMSKLSINHKNIEIEISELDIVTYLLDPNPVNICNTHVGQVYRLLPGMSTVNEAQEKKKTYSEIFRNNQNFQDALSAIKFPNLNAMLATFDSSTGKPKTLQCQLVCDWPRREPSQNDNAQSSLPINEVLGASSVSDAAITAIRKLMSTTTCCSLAAVMVQFFSGGDECPFEYEGSDYIFDPNEVTFYRTTISNTTGTTEWYLKQLFECSDIKDTILEPNVANQLLALKEQYVIEPPNKNGMRVIMPKLTNVDEIKDQMISLIRNNSNIKKVLGDVQTTTRIQDAISIMQKEAGDWVKNCSPNNVIKTEGEGNLNFVNKIENLTTLLSREEINNYFTNNEVSAEHILNCLYGMQALANYYMYYKHNGIKAREILLNSIKLAKQYALKSCISFNFDTSTKDDLLIMEILILKMIHKQLDEITDLPEIYTGIIYLLGRTYMYDATKTEGKKYFELSKNFGNKLKLFEGYLSERSGLGIIKREEIEQDIANGDYKRANGDNERANEYYERAKEKLNESVQLYQELKNNRTRYKEGYKPGEGDYKKYNVLIPIEDAYNQVECSEQLTKYYLQLIMLTNDEAKQLEYVNDISNLYIGTDELPGMLRRLDNILSKKKASIHNSLGKVLLKLYDQNVNFKQFKDAVSEELKRTSEDDLDFIDQIFTIAEDKSRRDEFTKADAFDGLKMVCQRRLKQEVDEEKRKDLLRSISTYQINRNKINEALNRNIKYESDYECIMSTTTAARVPTTSSS